MRRCPIVPGVAFLVLSLLALLSLSACSPKTDESPSLVWGWAVQPPLGTQAVVLEGLALDGRGRPLSSVQVALKACDGPGALLTASTDASGRFHLEVPLAEAKGCLEATSAEGSLTLRDIPLARPASLHALMVFKPSRTPPVSFLIDDRAQPIALP